MTSSEGSYPSDLQQVPTYVWKSADVCVHTKESYFHEYFHRGNLVNRSFRKTDFKVGYTSYMSLRIIIYNFDQWNVGLFCNKFISVFNNAEIQISQIFGSRNISYYVVQAIFALSCNLLSLFLFISNTFTYFFLDVSSVKIYPFA